MKGWSEYLAIITSNPAAITAVIVIALIALALVALEFTKKPGHRVVKEPVKAVPEVVKPVPISVKKGKQAIAVAVAGPEPEIPRVKLGEGPYKCMVIRTAKGMGITNPTCVNIIDFTTMTQPMGDIDVADTSCPSSGGIYSVRELEDGTIVDYDPREVALEIDQTPEYAYFATHWEIVSRVFFVPLKFWQSPKWWFAAACLFITFFLTLSVIGG